jgi:hypothetical protein
MQSAHIQQTNDGIAHSLISAGIGRAYHKRSISEVPNGQFFRQWVGEHARDEVSSGRGITIAGSGTNARDAFLLLARAVHLYGLKARVVPLRRLVAQIVHGGELVEQFEECRALFVTDFFQTYPGNPVPLTGREVQEVEQFLTDRLDDMHSVFVHVAKPMVGPDVWWSPTFVQRLSGLNRLVEIAG